MPRHPNAHQVSDEEVRDVIADIQNKATFGDRLNVVDLYTIVNRILGFNPLQGKNINSDFGGKSKDTWINEHLSMSTLRTVLQDMIDRGVITKVTEIPAFASLTVEQQLLRDSLSFPYRVRAGYVLTDDLTDRLAAAEAARRDTRRDKLMQQARQEIADKYARQVQTVYRRLCGDVGLDPVRETQDDVT